MPITVQNLRNANRDYLHTAVGNGVWEAFPEGSVTLEAFLSAAGGTATI